MKKTNNLEKRISNLEETINIMEEKICRLIKSIELSKPLDLNKMLKFKEIDIRESGNYEDKAFWLSDQYDWELKIDNENYQVLIPTRK